MTFIKRYTSPPNTSYHLIYSALVQSVERSVAMPEITGSIPALATAFGQFAKFGVSVVSVS